MKARPFVVRAFLSIGKRAPRYMPVYTDIEGTRIPKDIDMPPIFRRKRKV